MAGNEEEIPNLYARIRELETENLKLMKALERARGVPAEILVAQLTGGKRTEGYKDLHDVTTKKGNRIEVKLSKVHVLSYTKTRRWNWDRLLGPKQYDYLVLAGEKDENFHEYPPDLAYVFFLIPRNEVNDINSAGDCVALNTNFAGIRKQKGKILVQNYLVHSQKQFRKL